MSYIECARTNLYQLFPLPTQMTLKCVQFANSGIGLSAGVGSRKCADTSHVGTYLLFSDQKFLTFSPTSLAE